MNMFMGKDYIGVSETNTMSFDIENFEVLFSFIFINTKVEVLFGDYFLINVFFHSLLILLFESVFKLQVV